MARSAVPQANGSGSAGAPPERDAVLDLVRVACLALVVIGHLLMVGAIIIPGQGLVIHPTLLEQPWLAPVTWFAQIMPLFFMVGGVVGLGSWERLERTGGNASDFIRARILRLARPAIALFAFFTVAIMVLHMVGIAPESIWAMALGVASPLWFLAAYAFTQAFLPGMATFHRLAPRTTLVALAVAATTLDMVRLGTGIQALGLLNMTFVWLFAQQLGFWVADGWFARRSRWSILGIAAGSFAVLLLLVMAGYPESMLDNLNPPTPAIIVLAVGQVSLLMLIYPLLRRLMRLRSARAIVGAVGGRLMTIYLWHLPVFALVVGLLLLTPLPAAPPGSALWWWTRPAILALSGIVLYAISIPLGRLEQAPSALPRGTHVSDTAIGISVSLLVLPPFWVTVFGLNFWVALAGTAALSVAVIAQRPLRYSERSLAPGFNGPESAS